MFTHPKRFYQGFTLIELMIVIAIAAILMSTAAPAMRIYMLNKQASSLLRELQQDINYARNQAISSSEDVTLRPLANNWDNGWEVLQDTTVILTRGSTTAPIAKTGTISSGYTVTDPLVFDRRGRSSKSDDIRIDVAECTGDREYTISINNIGQIIVVTATCS